MSSSVTKDAVLLVDWLNLSIKLKEHGREFGPSVASALLRIAREEASALGCQLVRAHFVSERFGDDVERTLTQELLVERHRNRTAKEQADLVLTVLAMDHIHDQGGTPGLFIIATGDQDFVPLVERIIEAKSKPLLIAGSAADLANEYRAIVARQNVRLISLVEDEGIRELRRTSNGSERAIAISSLLRIVLDGGFFGGDQSKNAALLSSWRGAASRGSSEQVLTSWIQEFTRAEIRRVAVPGTRPDRNQAATRRRVFLDTSARPVSDVLLDADWVLRRCDPTREPQTRGKLGVGRFATDDGSRLDSVLDGLKSVGWLSERADGSIESSFPWGADGLLEPVNRLIAAVQAASYQAEALGVDREKVFRSLSSRPLGWSVRKGGKEAAELITFGRRLGVIDSYPSGADGYVLGVVVAHSLVRRVNDAVALLKSLMFEQGWMAEHSVLSALKEAEDGVGEPLFGHDERDQRSMIRPLTRADVIERKQVNGGTHLRLRSTAWVTQVPARS